MTGVDLGDPGVEPESEANVEMAAFEDGGMLLTG